MGEKFKKWVEESTEGQYVPLGSTCDLCGRKLGFSLPLLELQYQAPV